MFWRQFAGSKKILQLNQLVILALAVLCKSFSIVVSENQLNTYNQRNPKENNITASAHYGDERHPAKSCAEIFEKVPSLPSGVYWLEFLEFGNNTTFQEQHYCENAPMQNQEQKEGGLIVVAQKSPVQMDSMANGDATRPKELKIKPKGDASIAAIENLTIGKPDAEPFDAENLNEQMQWPLAITPPTNEEMRKRLEKAAQELKTKDENINKNNANVIQADPSLSLQNAKNKIFELVGDKNGKDGNIEQKTPESKNVTEGQTNEVLSKQNFSNNSLLNSINYKARLETGNDLSERKNTGKKLGMVLLNWKQIQTPLISKKIDRGKDAQQGLVLGSSTEKKINKEQERERLFVKPGLNRGMIESFIAKSSNLTKPTKIQSNGEVRDLVKNSDVKRHGMNSPETEGQELEISENAIGDPFKKPNPDELHSGLWGSAAERFAKQIQHALQLQEENESQLGRNVPLHERIHKKIQNNHKLWHDTHNMQTTKKKMNDFYKMFNDSNSEGDNMLLLVSPGPLPQRSEVHEVKEESTVKPEIKITIGISKETNSSSQQNPDLSPQIEVRIKVPSGSTAESKAEAQFEPRSSSQSVAPFANEKEQGNFHSGNEPIDKAKTQSRAQAATQAQAHTSAYSSTQAHSKAKSQTSMTKKSKSQLNMEKTQAFLAEKVKHFKNDLQADTESNYFHWAKQLPKKTAMQLRLEKIIANMNKHKNSTSDDAHFTPHSGMAQKGENVVEKFVDINYIKPAYTNGIKISAANNAESSSRYSKNSKQSLGIGDIDIESSDDGVLAAPLNWSDQDEQYIPSTAEINKRLNAIPFAPYMPKRTEKIHAQP